MVQRCKGEDKKDRKKDTVMPPPTTSQVELENRYRPLQKIIELSANTCNTLVGLLVIICASYVILVHYIIPLLQCIGVPFKFIGPFFLLFTKRFNNSMI